MALDGLLGHEQQLGDLAVAEAARGQPRHALLRGGQRRRAGQRGAARLRAGLDERVAGAGGERGRAAALGQLQRGAQRLAVAEVGERVGVGEPRLGAGQHVGRALGLGGVPGDPAERQQRQPVLARDAEALRPVGLLVGGVQRLLGPAGGVRGGGERRAERDEAGVAEPPRALAARALAGQVERLGRAVLREPQPREAVEQEREAEDLGPVALEPGQPSPTPAPRPTSPRSSSASTSGEITHGSAIR